MNISQTLVVKLGTSVPTDGSRRLNRAHIVELVRQCAPRYTPPDTALSSSPPSWNTSIYPDLPATITSKQLLAVVRQSRLIQF